MGVKRSVGVITFWDTKDNYGQLLQAYALQVYLKELGASPFLIKYQKQFTLKRKGWRGRALFLWKRLIGTKNQMRPEDRHRNLDGFRDNFLNFSSRNYSSIEELRDHAPSADIYITGSDQVWNYVFNGVPEPFFLQFGSSEVKRLAYAASFGHASLPDEIRVAYQKYLSTFDAIGVREKSGVEICSELGFESSLLPDPTLLLSVNQWRELKQKATFFKAKNLYKAFVYLLGNRPSEVKDDVLKHIGGIADVATCTINKDYSGDCFPTLPEWLDLIDQSNLVVTNSFHGMVFSIIFEKNFIVIPSSGDTAGMNERLTSLLDELGLSEHLLFTYEFHKVEELRFRKIEWLEVKLRIDDLRSSAREFLIEHLS